MKHGKKLTRKQKEVLQDNNYDPREYLLERQSSIEYIFVHRDTKQTVKLPV